MRAEGKIVQTDDKDETSENDSGPRLDKTAVADIGRKLRESYQQIVDEPVPDRFAALLDELEKASKPDKTE